MRDPLLANQRLLKGSLGNYLHPSTNEMWLFRLEQEQLIYNQRVLDKGALIRRHPLRKRQLTIKAAATLDHYFIQYLNHACLVLALGPKLLEYQPEMPHWSHPVSNRYVWSHSVN
jgi:hypothetical protein